MTLITRKRYSIATVDRYQLCGIAVRQEGELAGTVHFRLGREVAESAFFAHDHLAYAFTITNPENGRYFTTEGRAVIDEITATRVADTYEFPLIEAGQAFVLRDPSGRAVLRDRGRARLTLLFDALCEGTPTREVPAVLGVALFGPHPGTLYDDGGCFCPLVARLLG